MYQSSIVDYLSDGTVWVSNDFRIVQFKLEGLAVTGDGLRELENHTTMEFGEKSSFTEYTKVTFV